MLKYLILSLLPFALGVDCHKGKCTSKLCYSKIHLTSSANEGKIQHLVDCYNYDINDVNPVCPKKLKEPFSYSVGWGCMQSSKDSAGKKYSCDTKSSLDTWYDDLVKNEWFCYKSAKSN